MFTIRIRINGPVAFTSFSNRNLVSGQGEKSFNHESHGARICFRGASAYGRGGGVGRGLPMGLGLAVGVDVAVAVGVGVGLAVGVGVGVPPPIGAWIATIMGDPVLKKPTVALAGCGG